MWMRGGTSNGGYFLASDLPADTAERDAFLLRVMGSPDPRQIDGMGGADPLTSKVVAVRKSEREGIDVDYLFLQVFVDQAIVTDQQNCGNILAGVGPFAIERGLVSATGDETRVAIFMENTGQVAVATVQTPGGMPTYAGDARIDGVPGTHAPVPLEFRDTAGSTCGALLPTGILREYLQLAHELGLSCLVEAHSEGEVKSALAAGARVIGVNNRNLKTMEVDLGTSLRLRGMVPPELLFVSESGIKTPDDVAKLKKNRTDAVLIGESLMRSPDKKAQLEQLRGENSYSGESSRQGVHCL